MTRGPDHRRPGGGTQMEGAGRGPGEPETPERAGEGRGPEEAGNHLKAQGKEAQLRIKQTHPSLRTRSSKNSPGQLKEPRRVQEGNHKAAKPDKEGGGQGNKVPKVPEAGEDPDVEDADTTSHRAGDQGEGGQARGEVRKPRVNKGSRGKATLRGEVDTQVVETGTSRKNPGSRPDIGEGGPEARGNTRPENFNLGPVETSTGSGVVGREKGM